MTDNSIFDDFDKPKRRRRRRKQKPNNQCCGLYIIQS